MSVKEEFQKYSGQILINGQLRKSTATDSFSVIDPATEDVVGHIPDTTDDEINEAIAGAKAAQKIWWRDNSALDRAAAMHTIAERLLSKQAILAEAITLEMGKPYKEAYDEVEWTATSFRYYAELSRHDCGRIVGSGVAGQMHYVTKDPLGVVGLIMPFNFPFCLLAWQASAALGAGNAIVIKPSEHTSLCSLMLMDLMDHLPKGLIQLFTGGARVGAALVGHKDINGVGFTGSIPAGKAVARTCAETFKKALIETSGNDPFIVMPSAPIDVAAKAAAFSSNINAGQVCAAAERFYIHKDIHDEFVEKLVEETRKIRVGNGFDHVDMGPLVSERERTRYEALVDRAVKAGAEVACGGKRPSEFNRGFFVTPTVLTGLDPAAEILNTESFGPVTPVCRVDSFDEAIAHANNSDYALGSVVYTKDLEEMTRAVSEIDAGLTWINAPMLDNDASPFGGRKLSGTGSQLGIEGLEQFREPRMVMMDPKCTVDASWWFPYKQEEMYNGERD